MSNSFALSGSGLERLTVSTPGRICLFGEHQDYLRLPVIPCAISLRLSIEGQRRQDTIVHVALPDVDCGISFSLDATMPYIVERDYFRSVFNVLRKHEVVFTNGFDCRVHGEIPIRAGTSSSSAMVVSWMNFLSRMSGRALSPEECGQYAYEAEVLEFNEPGGMMDQYSAAMGGVLFLKFFPTLSIEQLHPNLGTFVLGDSGEQKDTKSILSRVRSQVQRICNILLDHDAEFSLQTIPFQDVGRFSKKLTYDDLQLLQGTVRNRDITYEALNLLRLERPDENKLGMLLTQHQDILRDVLCISTPKIDRMIDAAMNAGAYGGKINGSGGGGCMFVYAPERAEQIAEAIERVGGKPYIVRCDDGTRVER